MTDDEKAQAMAKKWVKMQVKLTLIMLRQNWIR